MSVEQAAPVQITRHTFTVDEYRRMAEAGILSEDARVELVAGEVIRTSPIGRRHAACVARLTRALTLLLEHAALIWARGVGRRPRRGDG